jgi:hypothetical protein
VTLNTSGRQTVTATDTADSSITGTARIRAIAQLLRQQSLFDGWTGGL